MASRVVSRLVPVVSKARVAVASRASAGANMSLVSACRDRPTSQSVLSTPHIHWVVRVDTVSLSNGSSGHTGDRDLVRHARNQRT
jgi:hypothetical protein